MYFDFLVPRRPLSLQAKSNNLKKWKEFVYAQASNAWSGQMETRDAIQITLVYLYASDPVDTDNIVKPIQDALIGLVYQDDSIVTDVQSRRRSIQGVFDLTRCPQLLIEGILSGEECVYVRVDSPRALEEYL